MTHLKMLSQNNGTSLVCVCCHKPVCVYESLWCCLFVAGRDPLTLKRLWGNKQRPACKALTNTRTQSHTRNPASHKTEAQRKTKGAEMTLTLHLPHHGLIGLQPVLRKREKR